ncbi:MAG: DUF2905 domain-containing protein [Chloroflexi bacterium]|nr:DUF2905 domain-containing protein [Chloroflexota bacterium]
MWNELGRWLITVGGMLVLIGVILLIVGRVPGLGRLPGDIVIEKKDFVFYAPLGTMLLLSIVLTVLLNLLIRLFR